MTAEGERARALSCDEALRIALPFMDATTLYVEFGDHLWTREKARAAIAAALRAPQPSGLPDEALSAISIEHERDHDDNSRELALPREGCNGCRLIAYAWSLRDRLEAAPQPRGLTGDAIREAADEVLAELTAMFGRFTDKQSALFDLLRALNLSAIEGAPAPGGTRTLFPPGWVSSGVNDVGAPAAGEREARYAHPAEAVRAFHEAFGVALSDSWWSPSRRALRQRLIVEEFEEWREAETADDPHATLDALVDMTYVIVGTALEYGWDFAGAFAAVHAANMAKLGTDGKPNIREDGKVLKPAGWQAADLTPYLAGTAVAPASPRSAAPEDK